MYVFTRVGDSVDRGLSESVHAGIPTPGSPHPLHPLEAPLLEARIPWEAHTPSGKHAHPTGSTHPPGRRLRRTVNERPVRILLECILVRIVRINNRSMNLHGHWRIQGGTWDAPSLCQILFLKFLSSSCSFWQKKSLNNRLVLSAWIGAHVWENPASTAEGVVFFCLQTKFWKGNVFTPVCDSADIPWAYTPSLKMATEVDGMHPTGMHSCSIEFSHNSRLISRIG